MDTNKFEKLIGQFQNTRLMVVGDLMVDRYIWGKVHRISPEAPVPVVKVTHEAIHLGGSANVVANIHALGGNVVPVGLLGNDKPGRDLAAALEKLGVSTEGLVFCDDYETIQKSRIMAQRQQIVRVDREVDIPPGPETRARLQDRMIACLKDVDVAIVSDYGKGVITGELLTRLGAQDNLMIHVDPKDQNFDFYKNVSLLTPNHGEAERMSGVSIVDVESLREAARVIFKRLNCTRLLITRGEQGMALFEGERMVLIPSRAREVFEVSGAGDTVIAAYSLARAAGATPEEAAIISNAAAGVVVAKLGTATLNTDELMKALSQALQPDENSK